MRYDVALWIIYLSNYFYCCSVNRLGSLLVDFEIIGTKTQSNKNKFESGVASSLSKILNGEHKFKILNREAPVLGVTMKDNNGSATMGKQSKV